VKSRSNQAPTTASRHILQLRNNDTNDIDPSSSQSLKQDKQDRERVVVEYQTIAVFHMRVTFIYTTKKFDIVPMSCTYTKKCIMPDKTQQQLTLPSLYSAKFAVLQ